MGCLSFAVALLGCWAAGVWLVILWGCGAGASVLRGWLVVVLLWISMDMFLACGAGAFLSLIVVFCGFVC